MRHHACARTAVDEQQLLIRHAVAAARLRAVVDDGAVGAAACPPAMVGNEGSTKPGCAARRPVRKSSTATSSREVPAAT